MKLTDSQIRRALKGADTFQKSDGSTIKAFHEFSHVDTPDGGVTESEYLVCARGDLKQGEVVIIDGARNKVGYIKDDRSGLIECFITVVGGKHGKYE
ncbi:hypothetical protein J9089_003250 [Salmonella enterica]|nr:hypothetical protein [Salmonella enterica]EHI7757782.1 hypothetical protein [Salmonella enterica]EHI8762925.1 hypothetical protein [Salmonella enterica]